jgi:hypothetical protein
MYNEAYFLERDWPTQLLAADYLPRGLAANEATRELRQQVAQRARIGCSASQVFGSLPK